MALPNMELQNMEAGLLNAEESPTLDWATWLDSYLLIDLPEEESESLSNREESRILDQQGTTDVPLHQLETNQNQLNEQAQSSRKPSRRGRKPTLNEIEKKERKRNSDIKYRKKQKDMWEKMNTDLEMSRGEVKKLKSERERSRSEKKEMEALLQAKNKEMEGLRKRVNMLQKYVQGQEADVEKIAEKVLQPDNAIVSAALALTEFLGKLEEEDNEGDVSFRDFTELVEKQEQRTVGNYQIPSSLVSTAEEITKVYGDVCATSTMNQSITGQVYILFCATIKEMSDLPLEQIDKKTILKWRDAIKYALCIKFQVKFALKHLKEIIAPRYFLMKEYKEAENIEASLKALMELQKCRDIAKQFDGKPFSEGVWSYSVH